MPKSKEPNDERDQREREEHARPEHGHEHVPHEDERERSGDKARPRRRRMGRDHAVHQQIVEKRRGGGAPATPEAYARALDQWHKLPGAVVRPPTDEKPATETKTEGQDKKENRS